MLVEGRRLHWEFGRLSRAISVSKGFGNLTYIVIMFSLLEFTLMSDLYLTMHDVGSTAHSR